MNRKEFIKNIGLSAIGISILPLVSFTKKTNKRKIYKLNYPIFYLSFKDERKDLNKVQCYVQTYRGTINELLNRDHEDTLLYYKEETSDLFTYTRAVIIPKEYNWKIVDITYPEF